MNPRIKNIVKWTLVGGVVFVALNLAYTFLYLVDLQPESLKAGISAAQKARGRALLSRLAQAHGATAYQQHETITFKGTDRWFVAEYASFQSAGGMLLPKWIPVGAVLPTGGSLAVHEIVVDEASFDAVKRQELERAQLPKK